MLESENVSPYMSITTQIKENKCLEIPAVCHIDNTARLQTVKEENKVEQEQEQFEEEKEKLTGEEKKKKIRM